MTLLLALGLLPCTAVHALQVLEAADGATLLGKLSLRDVTRLGVAGGGRVVEVLGADTGRLKGEKDDVKGEVYLRLKNPADLSPINLFVKDDQGRTYTLILTPADIPMETVLLRVHGTDRAGARRWERSQPYLATLAAVVRMMAREDAPDGYEIRERGTPVPLWNEVTFRLDREYRGDALVGERYTLTNVSPAELVMEEREFYRPGVLAVAVEKLALPPGSTTWVYVVREDSGHDK